MDSCHSMKTTGYEREVFGESVKVIERDDNKTVYALTDKAVLTSYAVFPGIYILSDVDVCPAAFAKKFCEQHGCQVFHTPQELGRIFEEMYELPEKSRIGLFKVKVLELLMLLDSMKPETFQTVCPTAGQACLAKQAERFLSEHMDRKVTVKEMARSFAVSPTLLKESFKIVYGLPIISFAREQKMRAAAADLDGSESKILEIAGRYGYENASKFACAFRKVMGKSPVEYRRMADLQMDLEDEEESA